MELKEYLLHILDNYESEKVKGLKKNLLANYIRTQANKSIPNYLFDRKDYKITASAGQGVWAAVPWMGIFDKSISTSAQRGYDIVYLFRGDSKGVYLSLNQGFTFFKEEFKGDRPNEKIKKVSKYWISKLNIIREKEKFGFKTTSIDLNSSAKTDMPKGYEFGNIYSKYYSHEDLENIDNSVLLNDLEHLKMAFTELRSILSNNYEQYIRRIVSENYIEELDEEILKKYTDNSINEDVLGIEVNIPRNIRIREHTKFGETIQHVDYEKELTRNSKQGRDTEEYVIKIEKERLDSDPLLRNYVDKIKHVSKNSGDGYGYDILSYMRDTNDQVVEYCIEVKSTTGGIKTPFYMSKNELEVAKKKEIAGKRYAIYRLFKNNKGIWDYYIINSPSREIDCYPIQYLAVPKMK